MARDEALAEGMRAPIDDAPGEVVERKMFGGLAFTLDGNMSVGVSGEALMVCIDPGAHTEPDDWGAAWAEARSSHPPCPRNRSPKGTSRGDNRPGTRSGRGHTLQG